MTVIERKSACFLATFLRHLPLAPARRAGEGRRADEPARSEAPEGSLDGPKHRRTMLRRREAAYLALGHRCWLPHKLVKTHKVFWI